MTDHSPGTGNMVSVPREPSPDTIRVIFNWLAKNDMPGVEYSDAEACYYFVIRAANNGEVT